MIWFQINTLKKKQLNLIKMSVFKQILILSLVSTQIISSQQLVLQEGQRNILYSSNKQVWQEL